MCLPPQRIETNRPGDVPPLPPIPDDHIDYDKAQQDNNLVHTTSGVKEIEVTTLRVTRSGFLNEVPIRQLMTRGAGGDEVPASATIRSLERDTNGPTKGFPST